MQDIKEARKNWKQIVAKYKTPDNTLLNSVQVSEVFKVSRQRVEQMVVSGLITPSAFGKNGQPLFSESHILEQKSKRDGLTFGKCQGRLNCTNPIPVGGVKKKYCSPSCYRAAAQRKRSGGRLDEKYIELFKLAKLYKDSNNLTIKEFSNLAGLKSLSFVSNFFRERYTPYFVIEKIQQFFKDMKEKTCVQD